MSVVAQRQQSNCTDGKCHWCRSDGRWLRSKQRPQLTQPSRTVAFADLFCGCGGMSVGLLEAAHRLGLDARVALAVDSDAGVLGIFEDNFPRANTRTAFVDELFNGTLGAAPTASERGILESVGTIDLLVGGPPCQGHSDLNNHTRREDPKNALYLRMARAAELLKAQVVIIENVVPAQRDRGNVVAATQRALEASGYSVSYKPIDLRWVGVPQSRRRLLMLASRVSGIKPNDVLNELEVRGGEHPPRTVRWAIQDLKPTQAKSIFDTPSRCTDENVQRINYLFENRIYDLPNSERPTCHRDKEHSYVSMYGRLRWDQPAQTITTGFGSMGQGRYVHPGKRRTITPHEAARLQTFPDWFTFGAETGRGVLAKAIGNAVPPLLTLHLGLTLLPLLSAVTRR